MRTHFRNYTWSKDSTHDARKEVSCTKDCNPTRTQSKLTYQPPRRSLFGPLELAANTPPRSGVNAAMASWQTSVGCIWKPALS